MQNSYNLSPLYTLGNEGQGVTIAIIDSFGNPNMASDLANFDTQMGLPHMCGEPGQACGAGIPTFQHVYLERKDRGEGAAAGQQRHRPAGPQRLGSGDEPGCGVGARHRPAGEHHQRDHQSR